MKFIVFVIASCLGSAPDGGMTEDEQDGWIAYLEGKIANRERGLKQEPVRDATNSIEATRPPRKYEASGLRQFVLSELESNPLAPAKELEEKAIREGFKVFQHFDAYVSKLRSRAHVRLNANGEKRRWMDARERSFLENLWMNNRDQPYTYAWAAFSKKFPGCQTTDKQVRKWWINRKYRVN